MKRHPSLLNETKSLMLVCTVSAMVERSDENKADNLLWNVVAGLERGTAAHAHRKLQIDERKFLYCCALSSWSPPGMPSGCGTRDAKRLVDHSTNAVLSMNCKPDRSTKGTARPDREQPPGTILGDERKGSRFPAKLCTAEIRSVRSLPLRHRA